MKLPEDVWYVRWFFWSLGIWDEFCERDVSAQAAHYGTNLCFFVRVILCYVPLVLLLHLTVLASAVAVVTYLPYYFFGQWYVGAALVVGVLTLRLYLKEQIEAGKLKVPAWATRELFSRSAQSPRAEEAVAEAPRFLSLLWAAAVAAKQRVCPLITFSGSADAGEGQHA